MSETVYIKNIADIMQKMETVRRGNKIIINCKALIDDDSPLRMRPGHVLETSDGGATWFYPGFVNVMADMPLEACIAIIAQSYLPVESGQQQLLVIARRQEDSAFQDEL